MTRYVLALVAALAAQECAAAPMVLPTAPLPSFSLSGIPLPTSAFIGKPGPFSDLKRGEDLPVPTFLPSSLFSLSLSLPTGVPAEKRQQFSTLSEFPSSLLPTSTYSGTQLPRDEALPTLPFSLPTGIPTGLAIPRDEEEKRNEALPTLPFSLPTGFPTGLAIPRGEEKRNEALPTVPFSLPTGIPTGLPLPPGGEEKRHEAFTLSDLPGFTFSIPLPTGSLMPKREEDLPTPTLPFTLPTGLPTGLAIPGEQKRQEFITLSKFPSFTNTISAPTDSLLPKRDEDLPAPTLPFTLPTGLPTGLTSPFRA